MIRLAVILATGTLASGALAADKPVPSTVFSRIEACRALTEDAARLACFDREVAAMDRAVKDKQVAVVDRAEIRKTRRSLFGISLPRIALFDDDDDEPEIKEVTATIRSVGRNSDGGLLFTLEDGATWSQTDEWPIHGQVKAGQKVTLKRASLGSFFADFEKAMSIRAKRLR